MGSETDVVRRLFDAFVAGDEEAERQCLAEDVRWHVPGRSPLAGDYVGLEAIRRDFFGRIQELTGGTFRTRVLEMFPGEGGVVVRQRSTGARPDGRRLDLEALQLMTVRDGRITEVRGFQADQYALDEFWN